MAATILAIGALVFLAHLFSIWFERTRVPDVLLLILLGLLLGPVLGVVRAEDLGKVGSVVSTVALVVILFEGGMAIDLTSLARAFRPTLRITLVTFLVTMLLGAAVGRLAFEMPWGSAAILGATVGGTGSAVVIPMVRGLKIGERTSTILILESAITDVLCIVMTVGLMTAALTGELSPFRMLGTILSAMLFAALLGALGATAWLRALDVVRRLPNTLFATVAFVFLVYGVTELLGFSGAIAALAFGVALTNHERIGVDRLARLKLDKLATLSPLERDFFAEVGFLLKTFFFVYLGLSMRFSRNPT
ncbi:MAG TPA: cation:proton antiporter, partial [Gemmatimonadales bacterium]|nr:cation:proton antiporter [Gemmatimonadales bacterium]